MDNNMNDANGPRLNGPAPEYERAAFLKAMHEQKDATGTNAVERQMRYASAMGVASQQILGGLAPPPSPADTLRNEAQRLRIQAQMIRSSAERADELEKQAAHFDAAASSLEPKASLSDVNVHDFVVQPPGFVAANSDCGQRFIREEALRQAIAKTAHELPAETLKVAETFRRFLAGEPEPQPAPPVA